MLAGVSADQLQRLLDLHLGRARDRHQVGRHLVALLVRVVDHVDRFGHLVHVERDADHVERRCASSAGCPSASRTCRRRPSRRASAAWDCRRRCGGCHPRRRTSRRRTGRARRSSWRPCSPSPCSRRPPPRTSRRSPDEPVFERVIVDQASVADRAVEDLQFRAIRDPRSGHNRLLDNRGERPTGNMQIYIVFPGAPPVNECRTVRAVGRTTIPQRPRPRGKTLPCPSLPHDLPRGQQTGPAPLHSPVASLSVPGYGKRD